MLLPARSAAVWLTIGIGARKIQRSQGSRTRQDCCVIPLARNCAGYNSTLQTCKLSRSVIQLALKTGPEILPALQEHQGGHEEELNLACIGAPACRTCSPEAGQQSPS